MAQTDWASLAGGAAGNASKILETGRYCFLVTKSVAGRTNAGDKDTIKITATVEGGPRHGAMAFHQFTITPDSEQSMAIFFRQMQALGLDLDFFKTLPRGSEGVAKIAAALVQRRFMANVVHETYNEEPRAKLERFAKAMGVPAPGGSGAAPTLPPAAPVLPPAGPETDGADAEEEDPY